MSIVLSLHPSFLGIRSATMSLSLEFLMLLLLLFCLVCVYVLLCTIIISFVLLTRINILYLFFFFKIYFILLLLKQNKVFSSSSQQFGIDVICSLRNDSCIYLVEPGRVLNEPLQCPARTILTCSPDLSQYKVFIKQGAISYYMPVWELEELKVVGTDIRKHNPELKDLYSDENIKDRFTRFGGIFRHVLPVNKNVVEIFERQQKTVLHRMKISDVLVPDIDIEKRDDMKDNISHFIMQYNVSYREGIENEFRTFVMQLASDYVRNRFANSATSGKWTNEEFVKALHKLKLMFDGVETRDLLFF